MISLLKTTRRFTASYLSCKHFYIFALRFDIESLLHIVRQYHDNMHDKCQADYFDSETRENLKSSNLENQFCSTLKIVNIHHTVMLKTITYLSKIIDYLKTTPATSRNQIKKLRDFSFYTKKDLIIHYMNSISGPIISAIQKNISNNCVEHTENNLIYLY